ncbi:phage antirepressor KilAC domain-containing protein [Ruminococcus sp. FC2018]|uniref:phage antirepressor n=1 Tax=Ruminococcus sp. FC2018 TaxID=1410617 RepID=UPI001FA78DC7|nr:phage antirepressor KilAC domain-containing protein [Ruminococcus sp. FC2018]
MTFVNEEFGSIRSIIINGEPWFVGRDIAIILGYSKPRNALALHVDEDDALKQGVTDNLGRTQETTVINESGFYSLVLASKLPNAKKIKKWVTSEVLPTIRKTGGYVDDPDKFADYYLPFADEATKQMFKIQHEYIRQLHSKINTDKPKVDFADQVADTTNVIDMGEMAKLANDRGIRIGRNRLFSWLRVMGILMMNNIPYQEYMDRGYFKLKESLYYTDGVYKTRQTTYVTGKGQRYIIDRLLRDYASEVYEIA